MAVLTFLLGVFILSQAEAVSLPPGQVAAQNFYSHPAIEGGTGVVYGTLVNSSKNPVSVVNVTSDITRTVEIHNTSHNHHGHMKMHALSQVSVKAGEELKFTPGALHMMLIGLKKPLEAGNRFSLTLYLSDGQKMDVVVNVVPR